MAFSASALSQEPRAFSLGPLKIELQQISAVSGDTSGTVTASRLHEVYGVIVTGVNLSAQPTISGSTATLAFNDPLATVAGWAVLLGR